MLVMSLSLICHLSVQRLGNPKMSIVYHGAPLYTQPYIPRQLQDLDTHSTAIKTPPYPPKVKTVKKQFFQDHHTGTKKKLLKISSLKTTTPHQSINC